LYNVTYTSADEYHIETDGTFFNLYQQARGKENTPKALLFQLENGKNLLNYIILMIGLYYNEEKDK